MRAGCTVSGVSRPRRKRPAEHPLLGAPGRDVAVTVVMVGLTVVVLVSVADHGTLAWIQHRDDAWLRLMESVRSSPATAVAKGLNVLGLVPVMLPLRIVLAGYLALRRRWWHFAAFVGAVVLSEALIGPLKAVYDRPRPLGSLVATSGASFPSGHSVAASVTVVALVIAFVPPGPRRAAWGTAAVAFSLLMALSRAYLGAHWLSDAVAGVLLGTSSALVAALVAGALQRRRTLRTQVEPAHDTAPDLTPPADRP